MKAILFDGSLVYSAASDQINKSILQNLNNLGYEVENILLRDKNIGNCAGDFFCWIRTPGICNVKDDNIVIAESIMGCDLMIYLTPVTFGGYSSTLKKMVDHQLQNISPYFMEINGETHHHKRYTKYPNFAAIGFTDKHNPFEESVFKKLAYRNSINFYAKNSVCEVIHTDQSDQQISDIIQNCLADMKNGKKIVPQQVTSKPQFESSPIEIKHAILLVGSPRTRNSTSFSLGDYLYKKLNESHIKTDTIHLQTMMQSPEKIEAMLELIDSTDLITLAFPLYIDSLPAPVIKALEIIAAHRETRAKSHPQLFNAIVNCGFPEAHHNETAQLICEEFAHQAGFIWGGSLSLGGGGMVDGADLSLSGGRTYSIRKSLDLAAEALIQGKPIPQDARMLMAKPVIPAWLYRLIGSISWKQGAKKYNVQNQLSNQPFKPSSSQE
jgi:multimeric flavodoxin WrbA